MHPAPLLLVVALVSLTAACGPRPASAPAPDAVIAPERTAPPPYAAARQAAERAAAIVAAPDRTPADRALDAGRHPEVMHLFYAIAPGMRVASLGASTGNTTERLARAVGPERTVYGHNTPFILERFAAEPWRERLEREAMANVVRIDREFDDPLPADVRDLDAVFLVLFYHDTVWMKTDRARMNEAIFAALRPGGMFAVIDHSAAPGAGVSEAQRLHRIEELVVVEEVQDAGFRLEDFATFLPNPHCTRDWNSAPSAAGERRGESDRFVLLFRKP